MEIAAYSYGTLPSDEVKIEDVRETESESCQSYRERDIASIADSVFSDIRSVSLKSQQYITNETELYFDCTSFQRAFPERSFALIVTLVLELPTMFLISGGSDRLCNLIGRWKYTTLISLLPICSAISGNVGLQASTLTTRAISHNQVRVENYSSWLCKEVFAAVYLGMGIGFVIAMIAYYMGGYNMAFAVSIFCAQFIGIVTAGLTG